MGELTIKQKDYFDNFEINEGGCFFERTKKITKTFLLSCIKDIKTELSTKSGITLVEIVRHKVLNENVFVSLLVFSYNSTPTFLSKLESQIIPTEKLIGYLIIIEIENYIVLLSRHTPTLKKLNKFLKPIQDANLVGAVFSNTSNFIQLKITNSPQVSDAIRNKSFEGKDLSNSLPRYNVGKSIVKGTKLRDNDQTISISFSTSRLNSLGNKVTIYDLCQWCLSIISAIKNPTDISHTILNSYARAIKWSDAPENMIPKYLHIDFYELINYIESEKLELVYKNESDEFSHINISRFLDKYSDSLELCTQDVNGIKCYHTKRFREQLYVQQTKTSLNVKSKGRIMRLFLRDENDKKEKLTSYINKKKCYIIGFDNINYSYANAKLYHDTNIMGNLDYILDIFEEKNDFRQVLSEKGQIVENMLNFDHSSMFYQIEKMYQNDETIKYVVCDDLGIEYADHIVIGDNKIIYVHSKCAKSVSLSASALQIVIGQAMKNIGNVRYGNINKKVESWRNKRYSKTAIPVCRKGDINSLENAYQNVLKSPNGIQEVCLAVNFISKQQLKIGFDKLKNQEPINQKGNVIQLIWLLSSFILACKEADMRCKILCLP